MPRIIVTQHAAQGLERCRLFLAGKNPQAAIRAAQTISQLITLLQNTPSAGRPLDDAAELRELIIPFGDSGYITLYRYQPEADTIFLLAFRHQKEMGY